MRLFCLQLILVMSGSIFAQGTLKFTTLTHNFGQIQEANGEVDFSFIYENLGNKVINIDTVEAECGCMAMLWDRDSIRPGTKGEIVVAFDPTYRPNDFDKEVVVKTDGEPKEYTLRILGFVEPIEERSPELVYKRAFGALRFKSNYLSMGGIPKDTVMTKRFSFYNAGDTLVTFQDKMILPSNIKVAIKPMAIKPGSFGEIFITYDANSLKLYGPHTDLITLLTDEHGRNSMKYINISADLKYPFRGMKADDRENAGHIKFSKILHSFGYMIEGEIKETNFSFTNTGKSDLEILQTEGSCGCTVAEPDKRIYKPGESGQIKVSFDSKGKPGNQNKFITVYSNDPFNPVANLRISANVQSDIPEGE